METISIADSMSSIVQQFSRRRKEESEERLSGSAKRSDHILEEFDESAMEQPLLDGRKKARCEKQDNELGQVKHTLKRCHRPVWSIRSICFLERCLSEQLSYLRQLVVTEDVILTADTMRCLLVREHGIDERIPDQIMNCYINIMKNQLSISTEVLMLSTLDTRILQNEDFLQSESEAHRSKMTKMGNNFLQSDMTFFPIQVGDPRYAHHLHWIVGVLNPETKEFQILNSWAVVTGTRTIQKLIAGIQVCIDAALDSKGIRSRCIRQTILNWPIRVIPNLPQQKDSLSSGLFALKYMQFWNGSKLTRDFTQDDIDIFRKLLVGELILSDLNKRKDIQDEIKNKLYAFDY
ncbi:Ubiquitin-like-specific protease ESD4 [Rhynchospora pubera]|uniref:Ubiquitin-like-specific protease ESD4 n=1 Tax=Rhynchospora pubera TaxID=906938 RepID=A0AAV8F7J6_9POAL|nr:Ubiquitin-like-specific protease ESD4 [Rhynchospora pubera]